jgi:hypothetical protein
MFWESKTEMEKFFKPDGSPTDLGKASNEKMKSVLEEWAKFGKRTDKYTDWEIQ